MHAGSGVRDDASQRSWHQQQPASSRAGRSLLCCCGSTGAGPDIEEKAQLCAACHGEAGIPQEKTTPVIWGQNEGYLYLQLRDFKNGARKNDQMSAIAADLTKDDMKALAAYFTKALVAQSAAAVGAEDVSTKALTAIGSVGCPAAISTSFRATARRRGSPASSSEYLKKTMTEFRDRRAAIIPACRT